MTASPPALRRTPIASAQIGVRLICAGLNREILVAIAARGPMSTKELVGWLAAGSHTAVRESIDELSDAGALVATAGPERRFRLSASGRELVAVVDLIGAWLASHPRRRFDPATEVAWRAFAAAADSWRAAIFEWIIRCAPEPGFADGAVPGLTARTLRVELEKLTGAGAVELRSSRGRGGRYRLTPWGRRLVGVLAAIARWELTRLPDRTPSLELEDAVVALLAALPLVSGPRRFDGICSFAVTFAGAPGATRTGGVWARIRRGSVIACGEGPAPAAPDAWANGPIDAWLAAVLEQRPAALSLGGREGGGALAGALVEGLHTELYGYPDPSRGE